MGRVGMVLDLVAESLSRAEFVMGRDIPKSFETTRTGSISFNQVSLQRDITVTTHFDRKRRMCENNYLCSKIRTNYWFICSMFFIDEWH